MMMVMMMGRRTAGCLAGVGMVVGARTGSSSC